MATFEDEGLFLDLNGASHSHNIFLYEFATAEDWHAR